VHLTTPLSKLRKADTDLRNMHTGHDPVKGNAGIIIIFKIPDLNLSLPRIDYPVFPHPRSTVLEKLYGIIKLSA